MPRAKEDPNLFKVGDNPPLWVRIYKRNRASEREGGRDDCYHYCFNWKGDRYRASTKRLNFADAKKAAYEAALKVREHAPAPQGGLTLKAAINLSLAARWPVEHAKREAKETVNNESYSDARGRLYAWAKFSGDDVSLSAIDTDGAVHLVQSYITHRKNEKKSGRTIKNDQLVISNFFSWLIKAKGGDKKPLVLLRINPASESLLTLPAAQSAKLPDLNATEYKALITASRGTDLYPVVLLCLMAGFRPKGACTTAWNKFDLERGIVRVMEKNEEREVPLSESLCRELKAWKEAHPPASDDECIWKAHHDTAHDALAKLRKEHGLSARTTLQALRRTADGLLYEAGVAPQDAALLMGHTVQTAERHYVTRKALKRSNVAAWNIETGEVPHKLPHGGDAKSSAS